MSTLVHPFESLWIEYEPIVQTVAYEFGNKGNRYFAHADDFRQEFIAWMLDNERKLSAKREDLGDPDQFGKYLARCLRNQGDDYLIDIRDQAGGQPRLGAYFYSTNELKYLLPNMFDPEKWLNPPQMEGGTGGRSKSIPSEGNNWVTTLADVSRGFLLLNADDQDLLRKYHEYGYRNKDLADEAQITEASMSYRHTQVLKRLQAHLGGPKPKEMRPDDAHDPWRGRRAISNTHARVLTSSYYDGES
jgi:hypothetical protein